MEKSKENTKTEIDLQIEEFMKIHKDILYKKNSQDIGSRVNEDTKEKRKAIDGKFTKVYLFFYLAFTK